MKLDELRPAMLVHYDPEQVLLKIGTVYVYCCTAVVLAEDGKLLDENVVRAYVADDVATFTEPPPDLVSLYKNALEASLS